MGIYAYKETNGTGLIFIKSETKPPINKVVLSVNGGAPINPNFTLLETVTAINNVYSNVNKDYKTWRDTMKTAVIDAGGFAMLSNDEKIIAASHNIGTGAEIAAAIPDVLERDESSIEYLKKLKGFTAGVRSLRSILLEAKTWSRCKKNLIDVGGGVMVTMPEVLYNAITINNPSAPGELSGNLLKYYEDAGMVGFAGGDKSLGILDFLQSTPGTRFENAGFMQIFNGQTIDGADFPTLQSFCDYLIDLINNGVLDAVVFA